MQYLDDPPHAANNIQWLAGSSRAGQSSGMGKCGAISLGDLEDKLMLMELACEHCNCLGRYHTANLIERFGRDESILNIMSELVTGWPKRDQPFNIYDLCRARWSDDVHTARYGEEATRALGERRQSSGHHRR